MWEIRTERMQYGVGQGCFHGQEVRVGLKGQPPKEILRFVYDCGSGSKEKALKWPVDQFTNGDTDFPINALYLSHFEDDHVNGVALLARSAKIGRIYVPYLRTELAAQIIARACAAAVAAGSGSAAKAAVMAVAEIVAEVVGSGTLHGRPVIMVSPDGDAPPDDGGDKPPFAPEDGVIVDLPGRPEIKGETIMHRETGGISIGAGGGGGRPTTRVWELVTWCYACDPALTAEVIAHLTPLPGALAPFLDGLKKGSTAIERQKALKWIKDNFKEIAKSYRAAVNAYNKLRKSAGKRPIADDHNVTSLCVYSGPTFKPDGDGVYSSNRMPWFGWAYGCCVPGTPGGNASWLATGDALLEDPTVWSAFAGHFGSRRLSRCCTVLIPHHGSGKGGNFNEQLVDIDRICVISAGASNGYRHPGRPVISGIFGRQGYPVIVTEAEPLGFVEYLRLGI
jgi:hypothetical protein